MFSVTDGQPGWLTSVMNACAHLAGQNGVALSVALAAASAFAAFGVLVPRLVRPALLVACGLSLLFWVAEGLGGIFTGQGTDPNTGPLLILLAACFWPRRPQESSEGRSHFSPSTCSPRKASTV